VCYHIVKRKEDKLGAREEIEEKLKTEMEQQNKQLQIMVNSLVTENMDLKNRIQAVERKFSDIEKTIQDLKKTVES
jgi:predicted nuclease with TOPRIM domain